MVWNKYYKSHQIIPNIDLKDLDFNIFLKQRKIFIIQRDFQYLILKVKHF